MNIRVEYCNSKPISISLPEQVEAIIAEAEISIKGQTATASYKPATLENGIRIMVPPFIESGEKIIINTEDFSYVSRAKNS
jgi:elongation factor P